VAVVSGETGRVLTVEELDDRISDCLMAARLGKYDGRTVESHLKSLLRDFRAARLADADARLVAAEALADEWIERARTYYDIEDGPLYVVLSSYAGQLRAVLHPDPSHSEARS
jgi:DNA-binding transcriptional ArsR family regulator